MSGSQPVRLYDSYGHAIATTAVSGGNYALTSVPTTVTAYAFEALAITSAAAVPLTASVYDDSNIAFIVNETAPIRVRWDGTAPDASTGHLLVAGAIIELDNATDLANFQAIAVGDASSITITYSVEA